MDDIRNLEKIFQLKNINRIVTVGDRAESVAEHCWSSLLLADYFIEKIKLTINRQKVYDLLIYHDLIELETGDIAIHEKKNLKSKKQNEIEAIPNLVSKLPFELQNKFQLLFKEFEDNNTIEARFANAIDKLDPMIQCLYKKELYIKYNINEKLIREKKQKYMKYFPVINKAYEDIIDFYKKNGYF